MFSSLLPIAFIASTALAQSVSIGVPAAGTVLTPGAGYVVQVQEADALTNIQDVAVVIGLQECQSDCIGVDESLGTVLYSGLYTPQFHEDGLPPYENFSVQIPATVSSTTGLLGVTHFYLVGDGFAPEINYANQSVTLA